MCKRIHSLDGTMLERAEEVFETARCNKHKVRRRELYTHIWIPLHTLSTRQDLELYRTHHVGAHLGEHVSTRCYRTISSEGKSVRNDHRHTWCEYPSHAVCITPLPMISTVAVTDIALLSHVQPIMPPILLRLWWLTRW